MASNLRAKQEAGDQIVQIIAQYNDRPLGEQLLVGTRGPLIGRATVALLVGGVLLFGVGMVVFSTQLMSVYRQQAHRAQVRDFVKERGLPVRLIPKVRSRGAVEAAGLGALLAGVFVLVLGAIRLRSEWQPRRFTIGEHPACDVAMPSDALGQTRFPLVFFHHEQGRFLLRFTPQMPGFVEDAKGNTRALSALVESQEAWPESQGDGLHVESTNETSADVHVWSIPLGVTCRLKVGDVTIRICSQDASDLPALHRSRRPALRVLGSTLGLCMLWCGALAAITSSLAWWQRQGQLQKRFEVDNTARNRLLEVHASKSRPSKKQAARKMPIIQRDQTVSDSYRPRQEIRSGGAASTRPSRPRLRREHNLGPAGSAPARAPGLLGAISLVGDLGSAGFGAESPEAAEAALAALVPPTLASHSSPDALALLGLGGGGRSGGVGGLGDKSYQPGCGHDCKWSGDAWAMPGPTKGMRALQPSVQQRDPRRILVYLCGKPRRRPETAGLTVPRPHCSSSDDGADREAIRRQVRSNLQQVRYCYEANALAASATLAGDVTVTFTIAPDGRVTTSMVSASSLGDLATEQCLVSTIRRWRFPLTERTFIKVRYPFSFHPSGS